MRDGQLVAVGLVGGGAGNSAAYLYTLICDEPLK